MSQPHYLPPPDHEQRPAFGAGPVVATIIGSLSLWFAAALIGVSQ